MPYALVNEGRPRSRRNRSRPVKFTNKKSVSFERLIRVRDESLVCADDGQRTFESFNYKLKTNNAGLYQAPFETAYTIGVKVNESNYLACSDQADLVRTNIRGKRIALGQDVIIRETQIFCGRNDLSQYIEDNYKGNQILQSSASSGMVIFNDINCWFEYSANTNSTKIIAFGDMEWSDAIIKKFTTDYDTVISHIEWVYAPDGSSVNVPLNGSRLPVTEMYPFLGDETLECYYDRYLKSNCSILLLIGPPGTAKTTFIRGLLEYAKSSAIVTYDSNILEKDYVFANFVDSDSAIMVLEDSDAFLKARSDGNTMMHRFLNVGDGLVTTAGKKLIFSTNLPSIRDIDSALTRPGRCFDILTFDYLTQEQAEKLAAKFGIKLPDVRNHWSVAEVFNEQKHKTTERRVGFV